MSLEGIENFSLPGTPARSITLAQGDDLASPASIRAWTIPRITAELKRRQIPFPATARKAELFRLLRTSTSNAEAGEGPSQSSTGDIHAMLASLMTSMSRVNDRLERLESVTTSLSLAGPPPAASPAPSGLPVGVPSINPDDQEVSPAHMIPEHLKRDILEAFMSQHPSRHLTDFLVAGLTEGFHTGILHMPTGTLECPNLLSAQGNPTAIDALIAQEVAEGFVLGPFKTPPFTTWRTNPIGIVTGKSSQKQRLIIDLSAPHGSADPSLNSLIPSEEFSLQYTTIDHAITAIRQAGVGAWLSKTDIANAFKLLPIHPSLWHLHGIKWSENYYFFSRLTFGSKSSPAIFDTFAEALCWLLLNVARCPMVLHYLDDFLLVEENISPPASLRATIKLFGELGVPISTKKTEGPDTVITFLGIQLDSASMQASLPLGKIQAFHQALPSASPTASITPSFHQLILD
ncbi:uncharacterized protein LOC121002497 [Bufo bufo]|uniref:uncharacterized protein LOC121002497 n=1 Tax=Bufo bufo TaxID=8384 RepID=UPI001ABE81DD|nr:uncharacterized protein LOC121002497 [Bufo bufo]